ncbi:hypothetical protein ACLOJK_001047 [Asimina triloba]
MEGKKPSMATSNRTIPANEDEIQSLSSSEVEEDEEEEELEQELADVTFEELQKARASGFHSATRRPALESKPRRANKNRPMEMSSKKPVGRFREVVQAPKKVARDPRFESLCGTLDTDGYAPLASPSVQEEKLQKLIKKSKDPKVIEELKTHISWIDKQLKAGPSRSADAKILAEHKKKEREAAKQGKRPFYLKKSEIRERKLIEKYNQLKAKGKLDAFIEKRRKRNAAKDHRYMPYRRAHDND